MKFAKDFNDKVIENFKGRRERAGIGKTTTNRHIGMLKNMMKYSYEKKYIDTDYSSKTKKFKISEKKAKIPVDHKFIDILLDNVEEPYKTAIFLVLYAGLRRGEACNLEINDINFDKDLISIKPKPHLNWTPKTTESIRNALLNQYLKTHLKKVVENAEGKTNFVCYYPNTFAGLKEGALTGQFGKLKKRLNLPDYLTFQKLRHVYATRLAEEGVSPILIAKLMGHATASDVAEMIYIEVRDEVLLEAANKVSYKRHE